MPGRGARAGVHLSTLTVSVVIPTHNRSDLLLRAVQSALMQTRPPLEVVIVDDGSSDDTAARVAALGDARVRLLRHESARGAAAARNTGIQAARGDVIAFLDSDDEWLPEKLALQIDRIERGAADVVYGRDIAVHPDGREWVNREPLHGDDIRAHLLDGWCPTTTSLFAVRRERLLEVGGFDDQLPSFHDYDLWLRLSERASFDWVDAPLIRFHLHEGARISAQIEARQRAFARFLAKWEPTLREHMGAARFDAWVRQARAMDLRRAGFGALKRSERGEAVRLLGAALRQQPRQLRSWLHFAVALAGPGAYRLLARMRR